MNPLKHFIKRDKDSEDLRTRWKPVPSCPKCHSTNHIRFFDEYTGDRRQICKKCGYIGEEIEFVMYPPY